MFNKKIIIILVVMIIISSLGFAQVTDEDLRTGAVLYYKSDTNGSYPDAVGTSNGTFHGSNYTNNGKINGAYDFESNDFDWINTNYEYSNVDNITISIWVKMESHTDQQQFISLYDPDIAGSNRGGWKFGSWTTPGDIYFQVYTGTGTDSAFVSSSDVNIGDGNFHHIVAKTNTTCIQLIHDNVSIGVDCSQNPYPTGVNMPITIGKFSHADSSYFDGILDEVAVWDRALTTAEIKELYRRQVDDLTGSQYPYDSSLVAPELQINFSNSTGTYKFTYGLLENVYTFVNHSLNNNTILSNSNCTASFPNASLENGLINDSFTLNYLDSYSEEFTDLTNNDSYRSSVHADICSNDGKGDINVTLQCGLSSKTKTWSSAVIPKCAETNKAFLNFGETCANTDSINFTIINFNNNNDITIENFNYERVYQNLTLDLDYNTTSHLYDYTNENNKNYVSYTNDGVFDITAQCINPNPDYSLSTFETVEINNTAPVIVFNNVSNDAINIQLINNSVIEYDTSQTNFDYTIVDFNLRNVSVYLYNQHDAIIKEDINTSTDFFINGSLFYNYSDSNPYRIKVVAEDESALSTSETLYFYINDTISPNIISTLLDNTTSVIRGSDLSFNIDFIDESVYITNTTFYLANGTILYNDYNQFNNTRDGFTLSDTFSDTNYTDSYIFGTAYLADGHTEKNVKDKLKKSVKIPEKNNKAIESDKFYYTISDSINNFNIEYLDDRITQSIEFDGYTKNVHLIIYPYTDNHKIIKSKGYNDYLIIGKYWLDFESDVTKDVDIKWIDKTDSYEIVVKLKNSVKNVEFNSIGIINEISKDFYITLEDAPVTAEREFGDLGSVLFLGLICIIWLFFLIFPFLSFIPKVFLIFTGFISFMVGIAMYNIVPTQDNLHLLFMLFIFAIGTIYMGYYFLQTGNNKFNGLKNIRL